MQPLISLPSTIPSLPLWHQLLPRPLLWQFQRWHILHHHQLCASLLCSVPLFASHIQLLLGKSWYALHSCMLAVCHASSTLLLLQYSWCIFHDWKFRLCAMLDTYSSLDGIVGASFMTATFDGCTMLHTYSSLLGIIGASFVTAYLAWLSLYFVPYVLHTPPLVALLAHPSWQHSSKIDA